MTTVQGARSILARIRFSSEDLDVRTRVVFWLVAMLLVAAVDLARAQVPNNTDPWPERLFEDPIQQSARVRAAKPVVVSHGTAFHAVKRGYLVTNYHVVEGARQIRISRRGNSCVAQVVASDKANDLTILKIPDACANLLGLSTPFQLSAASGISAGADVVTYGFPVPRKFAAKPQVSTGIVKSITGLEGDTRTLIISNSVQPGSSGGPLFGPDGTVVGVVTAAANVHRWVRDHGTIPQNLNFAIRAEYVKLLFQLNGIQGAQQKTTSSLRKQPRNDLPGFISAIKSNVLLVTATRGQ